MAGRRHSKLMLRAEPVPSGSGRRVCAELYSNLFGGDGFDRGVLVTVAWAAGFGQLRHDPSRSSSACSSDRQSEVR